VIDSFHFGYFGCKIVGIQVGIGLYRSLDSAVGIMTDYGLDDKRSEFESQWGQEFSLLHVQTSSGAYLTSYPMGTGNFFPRGKVARTES
jgi:hypothetical protein